jgi:ubiquinone/menaquinone biosynthesis C-methylase UbiE
VDLLNDDEKRMDSFSHMVRESYSSDQAIDKYVKRVEEGLREWEKAVIDQFSPKEGRVLVVGCGAGREAFALEESGFHVTGVDISHALLAKTQEIATERNSTAEFLIGDGTRLDFPPETFNAVTLWNQVLGNVPGKAARATLLRECFKVLKSGGILSLSVHDLERTLPLISPDMMVSDNQTLEEGDLLLRDPENEKKVQYWHSFSQGEISQMCQEAGLKNIHVYHTFDFGETWDNVFVVVGLKSDDGV